MGPFSSPVSPVTTAANCYSSSAPHGPLQSAGINCRSRHGHHTQCTQSPSLSEPPQSHVLAVVSRVPKLLYTSSRRRKGSRRGMEAIGIELLAGRGEERSLSPRRGMKVKSWPHTLSHCREPPELTLDKDLRVSGCLGATPGSTVRRDRGDKQCLIRTFNTMSLLCRPQFPHL